MVRFKPVRFDFRWLGPGVVVFVRIGYRGPQHATAKPEEQVQASATSWSSILEGFSVKPRFDCPVRSICGEVDR